MTYTIMVLFRPIGLYKTAAWSVAIDEPPDVFAQNVKEVTSSNRDVLQTWLVRMEKTNKASLIGYHDTMDEIAVAYQTWSYKVYLDHFGDIWIKVDNGKPYIVK